MSRSAIVIRDARPTDVPVLVDLWAPVMRRAAPEQLAEDLLTLLEEAEADTRQRVLVAESDGVVVGAVHLEVATLTAINREPVLRILSPHVASGARGRGVGIALMDTAATFAEEQGIGHVASAAVAGARDANRFMARLGLTHGATLRIAPTSTLRARIASRRAPRTGGAKPLTSVLAARRSSRRARESG